MSRKKTETLSLQSYSDIMVAILSISLHCPK